jgi:hypothetical protein
MNRKGNSVNKNQAVLNLIGTGALVLKVLVPLTGPDSSLMEKTATSAASPKHLPPIALFNLISAARGSSAREYTPSQNKARPALWKGGAQTPGLDGRQEAGTTIELQLMFL